MGQRLQTILTVVCGVALVASWFAPGQAKAALAIVSVLAGSVFALQKAWESLLERVVNVDTLMVLAAVGAVILGHFQEAAVLLFLFSLSNTLEGFALGRTKSAIDGLIKLRPDEAILVTSEGDTKVPVSDVQAGQLVRVLAYEHVPLDGEVVEGATHVNQSAMTGEAEPVPRHPNDKLLAGTQNLEGMVVMRVTQAAGDTTLEKIVELVRDAQENKASGERISQWFGQTYTLFVIGAFVLSLVIRLAVFRQPVNDAAYSALTLLVALSPCALVISTPATTLSALAWAARHGILIRGGQFIEQAGKVDTAFVDKTGTLTVGRPVLSELCVCSTVPQAVAVAAGCSDEEACWHGGAMTSEAKVVLRAAASAEQYSTHPIAEAIVAGAKAAGIEVPPATGSETISGMGVVAMVDGERVKIGQPRFFEHLPEGFEHHADKMRHEGMTVAVMEHRNRYAALGLRDSPRPEAKAMLESLRRAGVKAVHMLTGDNASTARAIHAELGPDSYSAGLLPDEKEAIVAKAVDEGKCVMFVGDGVNDAPSLAKAHVGVAMGGLGSDVALNAADVVLMQDNLARIPQVIALGKRTNRIVRGNLFFGATVIVGLVLATFLVDALAPHLHNLLLPFAVVGHEGSTVIVILSGLRLLGGPGRIP